MATNTFVEIDLAEASDLADYTGIEYDLRSAQGMAQMLVDQRKKPQPDWPLSDALMTAALVRYFRPFSWSSRRRSLGDEALAELTPDQRAKHEYFKAIRDKYVAHSENTFEENRPVARYWMERVHEEGITSIECIQHRVSGLSVNDFVQLIELSNLMLNYVQYRIKVEKAKVLEIVRLMPLERILTGTGKPIVPDISDPSMPRPK